MKEKDLIKQLSSLKSVQASGEWVKANREILFAQINSGSERIALDYGFWKKLQLVFINIPQPAIAVFLIGAVLLSSSALSVRAARNAKPGDSLYIAKMINEKAKVAITFSDEGKARLGLEFARNRADELKGVLSEIDTAEGAGQSAESKEKVAGLVENYKKELNFAKESFAKIRSDKVAAFSVAVPGAEPADLSGEAGKVADNADEIGQVFSANLGKEDKGIEVFDGQAVVLPSLSRTDALSASGTTEAQASTSPDEMINQAKAEADNLVQHVENLAEETNKLLSAESGIDLISLDELSKQADAITARLDQGEVKGATSSADAIGSATTTD